MNAAPEVRTVTVERDIPYPPEKIWRALTQPHLIQEWLMKTISRSMSGASSRSRAIRDRSIAKCSKWNRTGRSRIRGTRWVSKARSRSR